MNEIIIENLHARVEGKEILKGVNLKMKAGEVHAIMGPNGTGKSTLSEVIMGNPKFEVTEGRVLLNGEDMLELEVDERARKGLFLAMQYPAEIAGITNSDFLRSAMKSNGVESGSLFKYIKELEMNIDELKMSKNMANRYLNEGFSGGEKKRNEILQLKMLKPKFAILDEIDSGLDIDALTIVGENLTKHIEDEKSDVGYLIITHYQRLLNYIKPTHVHVMLDGRIVESGGFELTKDLEVNGYDTYKEKYGIEDVIEENKKIQIEGCATHMGVQAGAGKDE